MPEAWPTETALIESLHLDGTIDAGTFEQAKLPNGTLSLRRLNALGHIRDSKLLEIYRDATGLPVFGEDDTFKTTSEKSNYNTAFLRDIQALPLGGKRFAIVHPLEKRVMDGLRFAISDMPELFLIEAGEFRRLFSQLYEDATDTSDIATEEDAFSSDILADLDRDAPIVRRVSGWLSDAADQSASDIHFEPKTDGFLVKFRLDGVLSTIAHEPKSIGPSVISRLKVMSGLDLGERNRPQDGRTTFVVRGRRLDVRVSIVSTIDGESAVIRLLDRPEGLLDFKALGLNDDLSAGLTSILTRRQGMFVVAGPTGSGKTTTLYSCLETLRTSGLKILSVEDPVEYHFGHVNQVQISEKAGRGFPDTLRAFLRHDPDIIMVGEIRDSETARIAIQASLTGHLVITTLHAMDRDRVRPRLIDMGIEPYQLDAALIGTMAQRLVRRLCPYCKTNHEPHAEELQSFADHPDLLKDKLYSAEGCTHCSGTGYRGRFSIAELSTSRQNAFHSPDMRTNALIALAEGQTDLSELIRVELL